jgi:branched-chain amino acid transport system substrate-binding protein
MIGDCRLRKKFITQSVGYKYLRMNHKDYKIPILYKKRNLFLFLYLLVLSLIGPLIIWANNQNTLTSSQGRSINFQPLIGLLKNQSSSTISNRISLGDRVLITADNNSNKQAGTTAFKAGDYYTAIARFKGSLQINRNDPETWIYLNNSLAKQQQHFFTIAAVVPIGSNLNVAKEILRGLAQAQQEINNNGGISGKLLAIAIANDDNDPEIAKKIAGELVSDSKILVAIGHNSSDATLAAASVYQKGGLVAISPTSAAKELSGFGSYIFRTTPSTRTIANRLADYVVKSSHTSKVLICADSQAQASQSFQEEFTWAIFENGGQIVNTSCDFSSSTFNASDIPSQAIANGAEAILLAPSVNNINRAIEVARANKKRLTLFGSHTMYTFETLKQGGTDINGMILAVVWHPKVNNNNRFAIAGKKMWGGAGSWRTATAYDATIAAIKALKSSSDRTRLQKQLSDPGFSPEGALGKIRFLPSGDRFGKGVLVKIEPGKTSGTNYDFNIFIN